MHTSTIRDQRRSIGCYDPDDDPDTTGADAALLTTGLNPVYATIDISDCLRPLMPEVADLPNVSEFPRFVDALTEYYDAVRELALAVPENRYGRHAIAERASIAADCLIAIVNLYGRKCALEALAARDGRETNRG